MGTCPGVGLTRDLGVPWHHRGFGNGRTRLGGPIFRPILGTLLTGMVPNPTRQGGQKRSKNGSPEPCAIVTKVPAVPRCTRGLGCLWYGAQVYLVPGSTGRENSGIEGARVPDTGRTEKTRGPGISGSRVFLRPGYAGSCVNLGSGCSWVRSYPASGCRAPGNLGPG